MGLMEWLVMPAPVWGVIWIGQKLAAQAEREIYDPGAIRGQLEELETRYDLGEITEEEFFEAEEVLLGRLRAAREREAGKAGE